MRHIKSNHEPKELIDFKKNGSKTFNALKNDKNANKAVQLSLAEETGYVCCYCMQKIKESKDKKRVEKQGS